MTLEEIKKRRFARRQYIKINGQRVTRRQLKRYYQEMELPS